MKMHLAHGRVEDHNAPGFVNKRAALVTLLRPDESNR